MIDMTPLIDSFVRQGYVVIPSFLSHHELDILRNECMSLYMSISKNMTVDQAVQCMIDRGCVLDLLADYPVRDICIPSICSHLVDV